jgi:hypothetical protein
LAFTFLWRVDQPSKHFGDSGRVIGRFPDLVLAWGSVLRHIFRTDRLTLGPSDLQPNIPVYQIKLFKGKEDEAANLEQEVNTWLGDNRVKVLQIIGNVAPQTLSADAVRNVLTRTNHPPSDLLVIVLYERD